MHISISLHKDHKLPAWAFQKKKKKEKLDYTFFYMWQTPASTHTCISNDWQTQWHSAVWLPTTMHLQSYRTAAVPQTQTQELHSLHREIRKFRKEVNIICQWGDKIELAYTPPNQWGILHPTALIRPQSPHHHSAVSTSPNAGAHGGFLISHLDLDKFETTVL